MKKITSLLLGIVVFSSCSSYLTAFKDGTFENNIALRQMSLDVEDLKRSFQDAQLELIALDDRIQSQESEFLVFQNKVASEHGSMSSMQVATLERKVDALEDMQKSTISDLRTLSSYANNTSTSLADYRDKIQGIERKLGMQDRRLQEVNQLKGTLTSISQAMRTGQGSNAYEVQSGDSLGKIAYLNNTSVKSLKEANSLTSNRIYPGQTLTIPNS